MEIKDKIFYMKTTDFISDGRHNTNDYSLFPSITRNKSNKEYDGSCLMSNNKAII